jgi:3-methyladenine DNA glycosylase AlkD
MAGGFTGWSHVDDFCIAVHQPLLLAHRPETLALLERWNRSPNRWKRRASVVAFVRKVGESGQFTDDALRLCEALVGDPEDLVQKGVGWALKDVMRGDRERVLAYVKELRRRGVPSTITLYAIRDLPGAEREKLLGAVGRGKPPARGPNRM